MEEVVNSWTASTPFVEFGNLLERRYSEFPASSQRIWKVNVKVGKMGILHFVELAQRQTNSTEMQKRDPSLFCVDISSENLKLKISGFLSFD